MKSIIVIITFVFSSLIFGQDIKWLTLEEANNEVKIHPEKPILIHFYTTWCGFCKKFAEETLVNNNVSYYINKNYIPIKFNAEIKDMVNFLSVNYSYIPSAKVNYFAFVFTNGKLGYPTTILTNSKGEVNKVISGYKYSADFINDIKI